MAILTVAQATAVTDALAACRERLKYEGGGPGNTALPVEAATLITDYSSLHAAMVLVKADAAYSSLDTATKAAISALGIP